MRGIVSSFLVALATPVLVMAADKPLEDVTGGGRRSFATPAGEDWVIHPRRHAEAR